MEGTRRQISVLEKAIVNFSLPLDFIYHSIMAISLNDKYANQTMKERINGIYNGKIRKYSKLISMREKYGEIPERARKISKSTLCSYIRLVLAESNH